MTDDDVDFFTDTSLVEDPFSYFARLRSRCPVIDMPHRDGVKAVTGYDEASEVWRDTEHFSSCLSVTGPIPGLPPVPEGVSVDDHIAEHRGDQPMSEYLITQDPPTHTELRGLLMRLLTPKRLSENEDSMWALADRQLDRVVPEGRFEVLNGFAQPFALLVIADLLGVPEADHQQFKHQLGVENPDPGVGAENEERVMDPLAFLFDYFSAYVEERRQEPRGDVLTHMAQATYPDGSTPAVADVVRTATFLFAAGQDTTARLITSAMRLIGEDPALQKALRTERDRIPNFLEEVLRLEGPVKTVSRVARADTTVGGVEVPAGTTVAVFPHAANRDPQRFEDPDELRVERANAREHLSFGRGAHSCPGGPLARVEAKVALERIFDRTADIRIAEDVHGPAGDRRYEFDQTYILRGLQELHVEFTPVAA